MVNYKRYKEKIYLTAMEDYYRLKKLTLDRYGGKCTSCNLTDYRVLDIDHIFNIGGIHRKRDPKVKSIYRWLKNNNYPEGFQILCANCHRIKHTKVNIQRLRNVF